VSMVGEEFILRSWGEGPEAQASLIDKIWPGAKLRRICALRRKFGDVVVEQFRAVRGRTLLTVGGSGNVCVPRARCVRLRTTPFSLALDPFRSFHVANSPDCSLHNF
jgi:hypothetical protein